MIGTHESVAQKMFIAIPGKAKSVVVNLKADSARGIVSRLFLIRKSSNGQSSRIASRGYRRIDGQRSVALLLKQAIETVA